ncbi:hypothetical protein PsB1_1303 [Candidatus Phycosocius spiralis]|uniref:Uncharacterized protein n=1 Tax=Candidatus Phycosocius spiralis TaxID=2815099 RepID=A0ABQ4PWX8_9PROT|nr:hypothetical protein PsB1_1303 [Candidatus Phycosocius spiralis]
MAAAPFPVITQRCVESGAMPTAANPDIGALRARSDLGAYPEKQPDRMSAFAWLRHYHVDNIDDIDSLTVRDRLLSR